MTFNFEPNYTLLTFFFVKKFVFLELVAALALIRLWFGPLWGRICGLIAFALSAAGIFVTFAPALGFYAAPGVARGAQWMLAGQGMPAMILPAVALMFAAGARPRRAAWVELTACLMMLALVGLWIATMF